MQTMHTTNKKNLNTTLLLDAHEAALLVHALKEYIRIKNNEISPNTTELLTKLESYLLSNLAE